MARAARRPGLVMMTGLLMLIGPKPALSVAVTSPPTVRSDVGNAARRQVNP